ncbi:heparinase II/III family protein [Actinoplanes sp. NPDC051411]|uniref:heparinase II/III domain-containing protein n=1 Tax=Actinoplanes sp. NPDC051411 TaxID=3155522 RepID=UPI003437E6EF
MEPTPLATWLGAGALLVPPGRALPVAPADDRGAWARDRLDRPTLELIETRARADAATPWPAPRARDWARYFRDGDRDGYEQLIFARQARLTRATVLAAVTLDDHWLDEVADGVVLLCEQSSWCWPAHDDAYARGGAVLPAVTDPFLDLGAGEVAGQLAWLDHLLGARLDARVPGLRARIRHEVDRRVLTPFAARTDWHWLGLDGDVHNWNPWIHGNVLVAALRLADGEPARRAALVDRVLAGLDRYAASIPADGAIDEGYSYWWNGACRLFEALDLLRHATGGALGDEPLRALAATVAFPHRMHLGGPWYLNHADGPARPSPHQPWAALHRAARQVSDRDALAHAAAHRRPGSPVAHEEQGLGRLLRALTDPAWLDAAPGRSPLPRDVWLPSTQVLLARRAPGRADGLTLAAKGGHNGEHHNHNDVGSVVVALDGVPVLIDPGRPTYTAQTFGPGRYGLWPMRSGWHNTPTIRGTGQAPGRAYAARDVTAVLDDDGSALSLDLAAAYPRDDVRRWSRVSRLDRSTGEVSIHDSWELDPGDGPTLVHLVVAGEVRAAPGRAEAGRVVVSWEPPAPVTTTIRELDDPLLRDVWGDRLTRLDIDLTAQGPTGTLQLTVKEQA